MRALLFRLLRPVIQLVGRIHWPFVNKSAARYYHTLVNMMQPGDVILSTTYGYASNLGNPGRFKHAILYLGTENGIPMVVEAIGEGVTKRALVECIAEKDEIAVVRSREIRPSGKSFKAALQWLEEQIGKPYDYDFDMVGRRKYDNFFCSELCLAFWQKINPGISFVLMKTFGVDTVSPNDFYRAAPKKTEVVFDSKLVGAK